MKKYSYLFLLMLLGACADDEPIFSESSGARSRAFVARCNEILTGAPYGWKMTYYPDTAEFGGFNFLFRFLEGNRVAMNSELRPNGWDTSSYRVDMSQAPVLIFDSYNSLHDLANPEEAVLGGKNGAGYKGEFQFVIKDAAEDKLELAGLKRGARVQLIKVGEYGEDDLELARSFAKKFTVSNGERWSLNVNGSDVPTAFLSIDDSRRIFSLIYKDGSNPVSVADGYYNFSALGVDFYKPISVTANGATVTFDGLREKVLNSRLIFEAASAGERNESLYFYTPQGATAVSEENVATFVVDPSVNVIEAFRYQRGLDVYGIPKQITLNVTLMSPKLEAWRAAFQAAHSDFDKFQLWMPRGSYDFGAVVRYTNGGYWYWQAPAGEKAFNPVEEYPNSSYQVTLNLSYGTTSSNVPAGYSSGAGVGDFRKFLQQAEGFTLIEGGGAFWFRSNKDPNDWFKAEK
ncbi:MAG: DUF4302 domain-containing protein [Prevotellaceae bacterium]|jgi:hypothetical protein|nr:DUF4302 domain-containing protein [Prevotellaceae bacterium]